VCSRKFNLFLVYLLAGSSSFVTSNVGNSTGCIEKLATCLPGPKAQYTVDVQRFLDSVINLARVIIINF
jgi:hypothetical protein